MIGDNDIKMLAGKLHGLAELQSINLGLAMGTIRKDPESIKSELKRVKLKRMDNAPGQVAYQEIIDIALNRAPEDLMEY